jgi:N-acetylmuramoyl-L-alanine amidase
MANTVAELTQIKPSQLTIVQKMAPWSNENRPGWKLNPGLQWNLLQHTTGNLNDWATALMHADFVVNGGGEHGVSYHLTVDEHLTVYQMLPFDEVGFHAGDSLDSYWGDWGGWGSIAMELCVNKTEYPALWLKAKQVACAAWASILIGDSRWDYGTGGPQRFSADRYFPHKKASDDNKNCPTQLLAEGNVDINGNGPMREAIKVLAGVGVPPVEDGYPVGMDYGVARMLFGQVIGDDGKNYAFNPDGVVSKKWLKDGAESNEYPQLEEVRHYDDRTYFRFSNGMAYWRTGNGPIKVLGAT